MTGELNELIEQAVVLSLAFADQATGMHDAARDATDKVRALAERVREESGESHGLFADVTTKLKEAENRLAAAEDKAENELTALRTRLDEIETHVTALVSAAKTGGAELRTGKASIINDLGGRQHEIDGLFDGGLQKMNAIETHVGERLTSIREALTTLQQTVSTSQSTVQTSAAGLSQNLEQLTQNVQTQAHACVTTADDALQKVREAFSHAGDGLIEVHNKAMDLLRDKFHVEAPKQAETAYSRVKQAAQELETLCKTQDESLSTLSDQIFNKVKDVVTLTNRIDPPLTEASRLR
jgi:hypothetical protein